MERYLLVQTIVTFVALLFIARHEILASFSPQVWKKVVYVDRLVQLFKYIPREQLTMPDFVFQ